MIDSKQLLRQALIVTRRAIPDFARKTKNERIFSYLSLAVPWKTYSSVHIYESIDSLNEVDTKDFINYLSKTYPLLAIFTSKKIDGKWRDVSLDGEDSQGIQFDVIVVPMLGFDDGLNRLGYGGGHYDKFLSKQTKALTVGLCYEEGRVARLPHEKHDIPLRYIITEKGTLTGIMTRDE
jgi:5-formyltetrahydrofolate cyclo-ligase